MVLKKIIDLICEQFSLDSDEVTEDTTFEDLGADENDIADLIFAVEDAFEIDVSDDDANELVGVSDLTDLVENALGL